MQVCFLFIWKLQVNKVCQKYLLYTSHFKLAFYFSQWITWSPRSPKDVFEDTKTFNYACVVFSCKQEHLRRKGIIAKFFPQALSVGAWLKLIHPIKFNSSSERKLIFSMLTLLQDKRMHIGQHSIWHVFHLCDWFWRTISLICSYCQKI